MTGSPSSGNGRFMAVVAIIMSLAALAISLAEVSAVREQQRTSLWPYLEAAHNYTSNGFAVNLTNKGVGPAIVGKVVLYFGGEPVGSMDETLAAFFAKRAGDDPYYQSANVIGYDYYRSADPSFSVIAVGESKTLFGVPWKTDAIDTRRFVEDLVSAGVDADACYCSLDRYCWVVRLTERVAQDVARCGGLDFEEKQVAVELFSDKTSTGVNPGRG